MQNSSGPYPQVTMGLGLPQTETKPKSEFYSTNKLENTKTSMWEKTRDELIK